MTEDTAAEPAPVPQIPQAPPVDIGVVPQEDIPAANRFVIRQQLQQIRVAKQQLIDAKGKLIQAAQHSDVVAAFGVDYEALVKAIQEL